MKILFVGLGSIGQRHLRNLKKFFPKFQIIAYRKLNRKLSLDNKNRVQKFNLNKRYDIKVFRNFEKALVEKPDVIFICNPTSMHMKYALAAAKKKIHVFIDKPLSHNLKDVKKLEKIVIKNKIIFMVGYQMRFLKSLNFIKNQLDKSRLGKLCGANIYNGEYLPDYHKYEDYEKTTMAQKKLGGGVINSQIHELDYCIYLFGKPKKVYAFGGKLSKLNIDVEDYVNSLINFEKDNISVNLTLDFFQRPPIRKMLITGTKKSLSWDYYKNEVVINDYLSNKIVKKNFGRFIRNEMFENQIKYFFNLIKLKKTKNISDLKNSIESLNLALKIKTNFSKLN
tara:strand:+ start:1232 stop:2245 length:1014 start_codon:yes stop_codon:yes gene_type:complete